MRIAAARHIFHVDGFDAAIVLCLAGETTLEASWGRLNKRE
jgi:hypothetical protein